MRAAGVTTARWLDAQLVAPEAERGERIVCYAGALVGAVFATALALRAQHTWLPLTVIAVVAFDLFGGTVVNATRSAKRRFHRPGRSSRHHLGFVAVHVQPFVLALLVPGFGVLSASTVYALTLGGAAVILLAPRDLRRPVAFAVSALAITVTSTSVAVPVELAWFAPVLVIKLLLAHLLPEDAER
ncbi:hypothetical protein BF14_004790 [Streptomyces griseus]|nr:hypothetical protein DIJ69_04795 [Streptomyces globisporus]PPA39132.1 hypothetical protein BF14_004790 [Streptomyces griseus]RAN16528.1 hypothetical protein A3838_04705 [Streptomyces badius]RAN24387.1 hypothetical protein A3800_04695 [Streptomyces badius]